MNVIKKAIQVNIAVIIILLLSFPICFDNQVKGEKRETNSIVAEWHFDGDVNDGSGNGNHGVVHGNPVYVDGIFGQALEFDGDGDYVKVPTSDYLDITEMLTIEAWYFRIGNSSGLYGGIVSKYDGYGGYMLAQEENSGKIGFWIRRDEIYSRSIISDITLTEMLNSWTHIVAVYDGDNISLWINGIEQTHKETGAILSKTPRPLLIGKYSHYTNGIIDGLSIYDRALTEEDIMSNYAKTNPLAKNITYQNDTYQNVTYQNDTYENITYQNITYENHTLTINETSEYYNSTNLTQIIDNATHLNTTVHEHYYQNFTYNNQTTINRHYYNNTTSEDDVGKGYLDPKSNSANDNWPFSNILNIILILILIAVGLMIFRQNIKNKTPNNPISESLTPEIEHVPDGKYGKEDMKRIIKPTAIKHDYAQKPQLLKE